MKLFFIVFGLLFTTSTYAHPLANSASQSFASSQATSGNDGYHNQRNRYSENPSTSMANVVMEQISNIQNAIAEATSNAFNQAMHQHNAIANANANIMNQIREDIIHANVNAVSQIFNQNIATANAINEQINQNIREHHENAMAAIQSSASTANRYQQSNANSNYNTGAAISQQISQNIAHANAINEQISQNIRENHENTVAAIQSSAAAANRYQQSNANSNYNTGSANQGTFVGSSVSSSSTNINGKEESFVSSVTNQNGEVSSLDIIHTPSTGTIVNHNGNVYSVPPYNENVHSANSFASAASSSSASQDGHHANHAISHRPHKHSQSSSRHPDHNNQGNSFVSSSVSTSSTSINGKEQSSVVNSYTNNNGEVNSFGILHTPSTGTIINDNGNVFAVTPNKNAHGTTHNAAASSSSSVNRGSDYVSSKNGAQTEFDIGANIDLRHSASSSSSQSSHSSQSSQSSHSSQSSQSGHSTSAHSVGNRGNEGNTYVSSSVSSSSSSINGKEQSSVIKSVTNNNGEVSSLDVYHTPSTGTIINDNGNIYTPDANNKGSFSSPATKNHRKQIKK